MQAPAENKPIKYKREDFIFGKTLGEGSYSMVWLLLVIFYLDVAIVGYFITNKVVNAKEIKTNKEYAIKILVKQHIIREKKTQFVTREKEILSMTNHPFIVKLYFTFQDQDNLYIGLSLAKKGSLQPYIVKLGAFDEVCTRFYSAEIIVAVGYLHDLGIIHRDLKPENILLSEDMHIKLADFGTAKLLNSSQNIEKKNSFVGTAQYVSPELLTQKLSSKSSDWWALGCIIYQLRAGRPPFQCGNEYQTFQKIIKLEYTFPKGFPDKEKVLVENLLVLDPEKRYTYDDLINHPYYDGIDFQNLHLQTPPKLMIYLPSNVPGQPGIYEEVNIDHLLEEDLELEWAVEGLQLSNHNKQNGNANENTKTETKWDQFVEGHAIIKMGIIEKRKGLFAKRRQLLLTEGPELYYVDPSAMVLKGKIPWTKDLRPEAKNFKIFFIHTPRRTYYLEDPESNAMAWVKEIEKVHERYFTSINNSSFMV
nr:3-phosphoinositide-dependent protein kinase 1 isoform X2 [Hydra vulgaris]